MLNWILQMLPFALLMVFWFYMMRRGNLIKLPQKQVELLEMQVEVLRETNELLKKLSAAR